MSSNYYPQKCINSNCTNIIYVRKHRLGTCLQCEKCVEKSKNKNNDR